LEIEQTKAMLIHQLREVYDRAGTLIDFAFRGQTAQAEQTPEDLMEKVKSVTREDIQKVAEQIHLDTIYFLRNRQPKKEVK